jgi:hypothetical protein
VRTSPPRNPGLDNPPLPAEMTLEEGAGVGGADGAVAGDVAGVLVEAERGGQP